jgi:hypothetical protein
MMTARSSIRDQYVALYTQTIAEAEEYLAREAESARLGHVALVAHVWAVALEDCTLAIGSVAGRDGRKGYALKGVRGDVCGTLLWTRQDADMIARAWTAEDGHPPVRPIHKTALVQARKAHAEAMLQTLAEIR